MSERQDVMPPNPGSPEALDRGCTCAVIDNCHGRGFKLRGETVFWISAGCPLHGRRLETPEEVET